MKVVNFTLDRNAGVVLTGAFQISKTELAIKTMPVTTTRADLIDFPRKTKQASAATIGHSVKYMNKFSNIKTDIEERKFSCQEKKSENQKKVLINKLNNDNY